MNKANGPTTTQQQRPHDDDYSGEGKGEDLLFTKHDPWPPGGMKEGHAVQVPDRQQPTALLANDDDREYDIQKAVTLYAAQVRELEAKGETVEINNTNVVNNVLVHDWGKRLREQLGWSNTNVLTTHITKLRHYKMYVWQEKWIIVLHLPIKLYMVYHLLSRVVRVNRVYLVETLIE